MTGEDGEESNSMKDMAAEEGNDVKEDKENVVAKEDNNDKENKEDQAQQILLSYIK